MRTMLWMLATRARILVASHNAPDLAEALLTTAGAALAATLLAGALRGVVPLGPLLVWLGSLLLLGATAVALMAALRPERVRALADAALKAAHTNRHGAPVPFRLPPHRGPSRPS